MKTSEFTTELENYKKELNNRNNIGRGDIIRLINSYVELSVLDYMYLEKAYERKNNLCIVMMVNIKNILIKY